MTKEIEKKLIVIPTYNERENIDPLLRSIFGLNLDVDVLVVDDNSPDQTASLVETMMGELPKRLHLLKRGAKEGLGRAYLAGFEWGLKNGYDVLVEMDADFSHRPVDLVPILAAASHADFVVGSRYMAGGAVQNWTLFRKALSRGGSFYARLILGYPLHDWTGGFNLWHRRTLEGIHLSGIKSDGYSFQIELKYKSLKNGFKGVEVPILFDERRAGQSKMSARIVYEAIYRVWKIRF